MRTPVQIAELVESRLENLGISGRKFMSDSGLKRGVLDNMKKGSMPSADKIAIIADYLGVSVDYLLGREASAQSANQSGGILGLSGARADLALLLSQMTDEQLLQLRDYAEFLISKSKDGKQ